jgi:hypothetical protein
MGKTIDTLRESFDSIIIAFDKQKKIFDAQGKILDKDTLDYIQLHKEMQLLLNTKRPNVDLIAEKLSKIKTLGDKITKNNNIINTEQLKDSLIKQQ